MRNSPRLVLASFDDIGRVPDMGPRREDAGDSRRARPLHTFDRPRPEAEFDVDGWRLLRDHATIAFGDGGILKSYLALYAAGRLSQTGVRVLLADWELAGSDHRARLEAMFGATMPTIQYMQMVGPLVSEAALLSREVRRLSIDYLICDSIAYAVDGPPEAAEHAMAYFRALRSIGVGSLNLAHVNKSDTGDMKPFGSSFWHNSARATWFMKPTTVSSDVRGVSLVNRKANLSGIHPIIDFQFTFANGATHVTRTALSDVVDSTFTSGAAGLPERVLSIIAAEPGIASSAIIKRAGARRQAVLDALRDLATAGKIDPRKTGDGRPTKWFPTGGSR
jgi:hypothetical protein